MQPGDQEGRSHKKLEAPDFRFVTGIINKLHWTSVQNEAARIGLFFLDSLLLRKVATQYNQYFFFFFTLLCGSVGIDSNSWDFYIVLYYFQIFHLSCFIPQNPRQEVKINNDELFPLYMAINWGIEKICDLFKVIQVINGRAKILMQESLRSCCSVQWLALSFNRPLFSFKRWRFPESCFWSRL